MNRWLKSIISVFLGAMILFAGSSVTLAKMACAKSGNTSITLNKPDDCCKHEHGHAPFALEEKCCDVSSMHLEALQYLVSSSQNIQKSMVCIDVASSLSAFGYAQSDNGTSIELRRHAVTLDYSYPPVRIMNRTFII
jgi:hypothetical protein